MRSSAIDSLAQDYIRTARAKGVPERRVLTRHLLRNSLVPVVTLVGVSIPAILTAGLITEYLFNFPGVGLEYFNVGRARRLPGDDRHHGAGRRWPRSSATWWPTSAYAVLDPEGEVQLMTGCRSRDRADIRRRRAPDP